MLATLMVKVAGMNSLGQGFTRIQTLVKNWQHPIDFCGSKIRFFLSLFPMCAHYQDTGRGCSKRDGYLRAAYKGIRQQSLTDQGSLMCKVLPKLRNKLV